MALVGGNAGMSGPVTGCKGSRLTVAIVVLVGDTALLLQDYTLGGGCCSRDTDTLIVMLVGVGIVS
jgi:hypothetical protein